MKRKPGESEIEISTKGIAWTTDVNDLFVKPENATKIQWLNITDERFIVWMRVAGMPNFKKPWGIIHKDLPKGKYQLTVESNFNVSPFDGKKKFVLSTTSSYGGKNTFLASWYIVVGSLWFIFAVVFFVAHLRQKKRQHQD